MSKDRKNGNREAKKPKAVKLPAIETTAAKGTVAAISAPKAKH